MTDVWFNIINDGVPNSVPTHLFNMGKFVILVKRIPVFWLLVDRPEYFMAAPMCMFAMQLVPFVCHPSL